MTRLSLNEGTLSLLGSGEFYELRRGKAKGWLLINQFELQSSVDECIDRIMNTILFKADSQGPLFR